jgi:hypothetical protein
VEQQGRGARASHFIEQGGNRKGQWQYGTGGTEKVIDRRPAMNGLVTAAVTDGRRKWATAGH